MNTNKNNEPIFIDKDPKSVPREGLDYVEREAITAIVRNPQTGKFLGLRWQVGWETFITGGIEDGQTAEEAARAEILEETGYKNLRLVEELPRCHSKFYHIPKEVNRFAHFTSFLFDLVDDECDEPSEDERALHEPVWLDSEELAQFKLPEVHRFLFESISK